MTDTPRRVVIVGASLGGLRTVDALRRRDYDGDIVLVGAEDHLPYDRPPLSKQLLAGEWEPDRIRLKRPDFYDGVEMHLGHRAVGLDALEHRVRLDDGTELAGDAVVVATGSVPRRLPDQPDLDGLLVLRTLDDSLTLREALRRQVRVAVIGAGFIGMEVAATARSYECEVTVLEAAPAPLVRGVGPVVGEALGAVHRDHGVDLRLGVQVAGVAGDESRVTGVRLADGTHVPADVVVVGIGAAPATDWLAGSGVEVHDGVVCDATCRARGVPGVWALGDVARWDNPTFGEQMRVEHWTNAVEQAEVVADNLLAGDGALREHASVPYVWSDQYGGKVQVLGAPGPDDALHLLEGELATGEFAAVYERDGALRGAVGVNRPRAVMRLRKMIASGADLDEVLHA